MSKSDKDTVYISGHKNPDTDSVASAVCYAYLKNIVDDTFNYIPMRCGHVSDQTKFIFDGAKVDLPEFIKDIYPKVKDSMTKNLINVKMSDPISLILKHIQDNSIRFVPVLDDNENFVNMVGVHDLTDIFIRDDRNKKPLFSLRYDTLRRSLRAEILNVGELEEFDASIVVTTMAYESFHNYLTSNKIDISKTILVTGSRQNILDDVFKMDFPAIVIVGMDKDLLDTFSAGNFKGWVFASPFDSAQTIRCIEMATPVNKIVKSDKPMVIRLNDYLEKAAEMISEVNIKALPVVEDNKLVGIVTGTDILKKKKQRLILVDHNEITQAVDGAEVAEIIEIVDHHRLGTIKTISPVTFYAKPVGSTCTLVYQLYKSHDITIPKDIAKLLLGGILSDTVILRSPTTTKDDIDIANDLALITGLNIKQYGIDIFSATDSLSHRDMKDVVRGDFKIFNEFGRRIGISQVETVTLQELPELRSKIHTELEGLNKEHQLDWSMLLITDITTEVSELIITPYAAAERLFKYSKIEEYVYLLPGILSRKKQLLPEVSRILEELNR